MPSHPWQDVEQAELTVRLTTTEDGIAVEYLRRGRWIDHQPGVRARFEDTLRDVAAALKDGDRAELRRALGGEAQQRVGIELYQLLFPDPMVANRVFQGLCGSTAEYVTAERSPVRLRIVTSDDELLALPWSLTSTPTGTHLATAAARWTFEYSTELLGDAAVRLQQPAKVLLVCPSNPATEHFPHQLQSRLAQDDESYHSSVFFQTARTPGELQTALATWHPRMVVYTGHARLHLGQPVLCFGDDGHVGPKQLRAWLPSSVQLMSSTGCWTGVGGVAGLGRQLTDLVPACIVGMARLWTDDALRLTRHWLTGILFDGMQPAQALHTLPGDVDPTEHHAWTYAVHTRYDTWRIENRHPRTTRAYTAPVSHRLDRFNQRAVFRARTDEFLKSDARVFAVVGIAPDDEDACAGLLSDLLREDLRDERCDSLVFKDWTVRFPPGKQDLRGPLEDAVRATLKAGRADLAGFIRAAAPRPEQGKHACLWLDFGHLGGSSHLPLSTHRITAWLDMCATLLEPRTPSSVKIIAFLTADTREHAQIKPVVTKFRRRVGVTGVLPLALGVLEHVERDELDEFMYIKGATSCLPGLLEAATEKLFEMCRGVGGAPSDKANYRCLVDAIEAAEAMGWSTFVGDSDESMHDPYAEL